MANNSEIDQSFDVMNVFNNVLDQCESNEISYTPPLPISNDQRPASPENCPICIHPCVLYSTTDVCLHRFCFECIKKWAKIKNECPLCKKRFRAIRYNYQSEDAFSVFHVNNVRGGQLLTDSFLDQLNLPIDDNHFWDYDYVPRYVYSTTFRVNEREQQTLNDYFLQNPSIRFLDFNVGGTHSGGHVHRVYNRYSSVSTTSFRRSIYMFNWWAMPLEGSIDNVSVQDYIANSDFEEKLRPWINREANALLGGDITIQSRFMDDIFSALRQYSVMSRDFFRFVEQYIQHRSYHFSHELSIFLRSRLDMQSYDTRIRFTDSPGEILRQISAIYNENMNITEVESSPNLNLRPPIQIELPAYQNNIYVSSPEVIVIDSDSDSDSESRLNYIRGFHRRRNPVEVIELLSDSDSDSNSSVSTTSIHYRTSSTRESMSCGSPILIESSSDEMDNTVTEIGDVISIDLDSNTFTTTTTITTGLNGAGVTTTAETTTNLLGRIEPETTTLSTLISLPSSNIKRESTSNTSTARNENESYNCTASTSQAFHDSDTLSCKNEMLDSMSPSTSTESLNFLSITTPPSTPPPSISSLSDFPTSSSSSSPIPLSSSSPSSWSMSSSATLQSQTRKRKNTSRYNYNKRRKTSH